jgi:hypothetical protein
VIRETAKVCMAFRKLSSEADALTAGGTELHILIVDGKKEYLYMSNRPSISLCVSVEATKFGDPWNETVMFSLYSRITNYCGFCASNRNS